jgi:hypothetical protein
MTGCIVVENPILCVPQIRSLSLNVLSQTPQNFAVKLCVDSLALWDEFAMNSAADVEKHEPSVIEMMGSSIAMTAALSQGHSHGSFYRSGHDVIADYHRHVITKNTNVTTPDVNTAMSVGTLPYQD